MPIDELLRNLTKSWVVPAMTQHSFGGRSYIHIRCMLRKAAKGPVVLASFSWSNAPILYDGLCINSQIFLIMPKCITLYFYRVM